VRTFLAGLLTLSSRRVLMASLQLSNLPLPVSPLRMCWDKSDNVNARAGGREAEGYSHQNDALISGGPLHVVYALLASCNALQATQILYLLVFKGPVRSGFLTLTPVTATATGCLFEQKAP
jgi:hypothetical protein